MTKFTVTCALLVSCVALPRAEVGYAASKPKVDPNVKLRAALGAAQTVYLMDDDAGSDFGSNERAALFYSAFVSLYDGVQGMNRYQLLPTTTGADLVFRDTSYGGIQVLDGKTLEPIGTITASAIFSRQKYTEKLLDQLRDLVGDSKASKPIVPKPPPPLMSRMDEGSGNSAILPAIQAAHFVFILDRGTFPAPGKTPYQPGQMVSMLRTELTTWGRYQVVSNIADADLVTTFAANDGCVGAGSKTIHEGAITSSVPEFKCSGNPYVALVLLDAKTLQTLGSILVDQPNMSIKSNQPDPRVVTFQKLIDAWKSKLAAQAP
jgi:hypothetical protein